MELPNVLESIRVRKTAYRRCPATWAVLVLGAFLLLSACTPQSRESVAGARAQQVTDMGILETNAVIQGRDGGYSAKIGDHVVWLYGDTILNQADAQGQTWHHNSWSWTDDDNARDGITGFVETLDAAVPQELFPLTESEQTFNDTHFRQPCLQEPCLQEPCGARWALWPGAVIEDEPRDRALVFYNKVYAEPGELNFTAVGYSVAVWEDVETMPERPVFGVVDGYPTLLFNADAPSFGSAAILVDELLYIYGRAPGFAKPCHIARVPLAEVFNLSAWQYYMGTDWSPELSKSRAITNCNDIMSVFYESDLELYLMLYSQPLTTDVVLRTAPAPEGPWSQTTLLFKAQAPAVGDWIYDALAHPVYSHDNRIYVTYSWRTQPFAFEVRLVAVDLVRTLR